MSLRGADTRFPLWEVSFVSLHAMVFPMFLVLGYKADDILRVLLIQNSQLSSKYGSRAKSEATPIPMARRSCLVSRVVVTSRRGNSCGEAEIDIVLFDLFNCSSQFVPRQAMVCAFRMLEIRIRLSRYLSVQKADLFLTYKCHKMNCSSGL